MPISRAHGGVPELRDEKWLIRTWTGLRYTKIHGVLGKAAATACGVGVKRAGVNGERCRRRKKKKKNKNKGGGEGAPEGWAW